MHSAGARAQDEALSGQGFWSCRLSRSLWRGKGALFPQGGAMALLLSLFYASSGDHGYQSYDLEQATFLT